jgi:hypothetical protein
MAKPRKLRIEIVPPVEIEIAGHRIAFDGLTLLRGKVMVEYDVIPPLQTETPFGPHLVILEASDDTSSEPYPTFWHDFQWPGRGPGRTTTRLERRPPPEAASLRFVVRRALPADSDGHRPQSSSQPPVASFDVMLPTDHSLPWERPNG